MADAALQWRVEETCLNAWPALREVLFEGWVLRFSEGVTRRANSANMLAPWRGSDPAKLGSWIAACEALYRTQGLPTIFRVLSLIEPSLDGQLAGLGYTGEGDSCVLYGDIDHVEAVEDQQVQLLSQPTPEWFAAMSALQNHTAEHAETYRRIVGQIAIPAAFATLSVEGGIAAAAYGAIHDRLLCYESVITDRSRQRRGYARRIVTSLAAWAKGQRAEGACLEVEAHNGPARALYDAIGLKAELHRYHYRREPRGRSITTGSQ